MVTNFYENKSDIRKILFLAFLMLFIVLLISCSHSQNLRKNLHSETKVRDNYRKDRREVTSSLKYIGFASYYADEFHGRQTANGETFDMNAMTAAHKTLPFGTICRVTNLENGKSVLVRINDRGPFVKERIIDLSKGAAGKIGAINSGVIKVKIEVISIPKSN